MRRTLALLVVTMAMGAPAAAHAVIPSGNLLVNPGAEKGLASDDDTHFFGPPDWFFLGHTTQVHYGAPNGPFGFPSQAVADAIGGGTAFFAGGPDQGTGYQSQSFDLTPYAAEIDRGKVRATLSALLGGFGTQTDAAQVTATFPDPDNGDTKLLTLQAGPVTPADRGNVTTLLPRSDSGFIPKGVRHVDVAVSMFRYEGTYDDGYADNVSLTLRDEAPPVVHTTGADQVEASTARVVGTLDDLGRPTTYRVEFGPTTAYGSTSGDVTTAGAAGTKDVAITLGGLAADTGYHARLVADGPLGPVAGEDVTFHTGGVNGTEGLPPGLDFTWSPRKDVLIAGAPSAGVQFEATAGTGVAYAWDFDFHDGAGFRPDPGAAGATPRHGFTADGAHDTNRFDGADGQRRRTYSVRLRATAPNGAVGEITHDLVVMPNSAPRVDFTISHTSSSVHDPVTFTPSISDPDATPRTADAVDHVEWDFDAPSGPDLICDGDGTNCRAADGSGAPGPWFAGGAGGAFSVDFWRRALARHGLSPLSDVDLAALPDKTPGGAPLDGGLAIKTWAGVFYSRIDSQIAYLYDNASILQQSTFNLDAGEATGATYVPGRLATTPLSAGLAKRARGRGAALKVRTRVTDRFLTTKYLTYRQVSLTGVDTAGARTTVTHPVPLTPGSPPRLVARFVNRDPNRRRDIFLPVKTRIGSAIGAQTQRIDYPLTTDTDLAFDAGGTSDPDGRIMYYTLEVGSPYKEPGFCVPGPPPNAGGNGKISIDPPDVLFGQVFSKSNPAGTGPLTPVGPVGSLPGVKLNPRGLKNVGFGRAAGTPLPDLASILAAPPYVHDCKAYTARNVVPSPFITRIGGPARATPRYTPTPGVLLTPLPLASFGVETQGIVTTDPAELRFRIPKPGDYSVTVAAYDDSGLGAIQRTDGFRIEAPSGQCANVAGQTLKVAGASRYAGFSGLCMDFADEKTHFWTTREIDLNGVALRPDAGAAFFIDLRRGQIVSTKAAKPNLAGDVNLDALGGGNVAGVTVSVDGDDVGRFASFDTDTARRWLDGAVQPSVLPGARYKGSPVQQPDPGAGGALRTTFGAGISGTSTTSFRIVLPRAFTRDGGAGAAQTADIVRRGVDEPRSTTLETKPYADIARRRARARAALNVASTINLSGMHVGPVTIVDGSIAFDTAKDYFDFDIKKATIALATQNPEVGLRLRIEGGDLKEAAGRIDKAKITIFPGVDLSGVRFRLLTDPVVVSGGATFTAIEILDGSLDLLVRPDPYLMRLDGTVGVAGFPLGSASVQYDAANANALSFAGHFGYDWGPVSMTASLEGAIADTREFYIQGDGHACLWLCLDVRALVSNIAIAACGEVDLEVETISAGFAVRLADKSLSVFSGCDLGPYRPARFRVAPGPFAQAAAAGDLVVAPGTKEVAFRFRAPAGSPAPEVTLTGPDGHTYSTAPQVGDYALSPATGTGTKKAGGALVDQDPVDHITTFLIADPAPGTWKASTAPGTPEPASVELSTGAPLSGGAFKADVQDADLTQSGVRIGDTTYPASAKAAAAARRRPAVGVKFVRALRRLPDLQDRRLRGLVLNVPKGLDGRLTLLDAAATGATSVIRTIDLSQPGRVPVAFAPGGDPGPHELRAFITHADGTPRASVVVDRFTGPGFGAAQSPDITVHRDADGNVVIVVDPRNAGSIAGRQAAFELSAASSSGARIERIYQTAKAAGDGRFRIALGRFTAADKIKVKGRMVFGGVPGRTTTETLGARRRNS